jgi:tRNA1(Val) A37 N6-methylase TrmN6
MEEYIHIRIQYLCIVICIFIPRSLAFNGLKSECTIRHGDISELSPGVDIPEGRVFDLITGTPPYFPLKAGVKDG